jgi:hypothetical protein
MSSYERIGFQVENATTSSVATTNFTPVIGSYTSNEVFLQGGTVTLSLFLYTPNNTNLDGINTFFKLPYNTFILKGVLYEEQAQGSSVPPTGYTIRFTKDYMLSILSPNPQLINTTSGFLVENTEPYVEIHATNPNYSYLASSIIVSDTALNTTITPSRITLGFNLTPTGISNRSNLSTKGHYIFM